MIDFFLILIDFYFLFLIPWTLIIFHFGKHFWISRRFRSIFVVFLRHFFIIFSVMIFFNFLYFSILLKSILNLVSVVTLYPWSMTPALMILVLKFLFVETMIEFLGRYLFFNVPSQYLKHGRISWSEFGLFAKIAFLDEIPFILGVFHHQAYFK